MTYWIVPWNKTHYNLDAALAAFGFVDWHQWNNYAIGDIVFIYCTLPTGRLCYELEVERVHIPLAEIEDDSRFYITKSGWTLNPPKGYARFRLISPINQDNENLSYPFLLRNGMPRCLRNPVKVKPELLKYILENIDKC